MGRLLKNKKIKKQKKMKPQFKRTLHILTPILVGKFSEFAPRPHYFEARDVSEVYFLVIWTKLPEAASFWCRSAVTYPRNPVDHSWIRLIIRTRLLQYDLLERYGHLKSKACRAQWHIQSIQKFRRPSLNLSRNLPMISPVQVSWVCAQDRYVQVLPALSVSMSRHFSLYSSSNRKLLPIWN